MAGWEFVFGRPWCLWLLGALVALWLMSYRSLAGLGRWRRLAALLLRSLVFLALVLALAEIQFRQSSPKLTVIYLLDQSESIPAAKRAAMVDYVVREVAAHRHAQRGDRAGVIVFGREPLVEVPPLADDIPLLGQIETGRHLRRDATDLAAALKMAQASFPQDSAKRIVLISDGNENIGNARMVGALLADQGIGVDVIPIEIGAAREVAVEKLVLPSNLRQGQPLELRVVLDNFGDQPAAGTLTIKRRIGTSESLLSESQVTVRPGKNVFTVREPRIDITGVFTYSATFTPTSSEEDRILANNTAQGFSYVRGKGRALLIEDWSHRGEFDFLVNRLRSNEIEVDVMGSDELYTSLAELQQYDVVILANCPRTSGESADKITNFSDEQIAMLVQNVEHLGCGLVVLGGPQSYGAGGWSNTELEKALPVDCQIRNAKVNAVGALAMVMHASEIPEGNYWQKVVAVEALKALGPMDYCGVIEWSNFGGEKWLWGGQQGMLPVGPNRRMMLSRIDRMTPGDMPDFAPGLQMALLSLKKTNAAMKHMIVISDGDPTPPSSSLLQGFVQAGIPISTVAVAAHGPAEQAVLQNIAMITGGNFYSVTNPRALPKIFQREARRVAKPVIFERENIPVQVVMDHSSHGLTGASVPPISGFVLTTVKDNPLVEVPIRADAPQPSENTALLATWTYGLGRVAAWTSDAGNRWAASWTGWDQYDRFFTQLVRWAMRPSDTGGKFDVTTEYRDGKVRVVVTALSSEDRFLNLDRLTASVLTPDAQSSSLELQQVSPGRYVGEFTAEAAGNYFVTILTGAEEIEENGRKQLRMRAPILSGVTVPYSSEYNDRQTNRALLEFLAQLKPKGGEPGLLVEPALEPGQTSVLLQKYDSFRATLAPAVSIHDMWPWMLMVASVLFLVDVAVRRVHPDFGWVRRMANRWGWAKSRAEERTEELKQRLDRLRATKQAAEQQLDDRRRAVRYAPDLGGAEEPPPEFPEVERAAPPPAQPSATPRTAQESYTERLLKAKQQARRQLPRKDGS
ncbi:MAG: hypothetical protein KatS3mg110_3624 [Pirellulaceae bacterium]|nr:MAG: hypothetical protein KatS3mg110_3624 [Pirellulaceae bacterium]